MSKNTKNTEECRQAIFSFITPSGPTRAPYSMSKRTLAKALQRHRWFDEGELLDTVETGVLFPIIHFSEMGPTTSKPPMSLQDPSALGQELTLKQGLYEEIKHTSPNPTPYPSVSPEGMVYRKWLIFTGFLKLDDQLSEVLEDTWKDWTGARLVYMNLKEEFGLTRLSFWRRLMPRDLEMFMYIMTVQCDTITPQNQLRLLDFVQRMRVDRMMGYLSLYRIERLMPSTANVINGILTDAVDSSDKVSI